MKETKSPVWKFRFFFFLVITWYFLWAFGLFNIILFFFDILMSNKLVNERIALHRIMFNRRFFSLGRAMSVDCRREPKTLSKAKENPFNIYFMTHVLAIEQGNVQNFFFFFLYFCFTNNHISSFYSLPCFIFATSSQKHLLISLKMILMNLRDQWMCSCLILRNLHNNVKRSRRKKLFFFVYEMNKSNKWTKKISDFLLFFWFLMFGAKKSFYLSKNTWLTPS